MVLKLGTVPIGPDVDAFLDSTHDALGRLKELELKSKCAEAIPGILCLTPSDGLAGRSVDDLYI